MFQSKSSPSAHKAQTNTDYYLCHRRATRCEQQPHGRPEQLAGSKMWLVDALIEEAMGHDCVRSGPSLRLTLTVGGSPLQRIFTVCLPDPSCRVRLMAEPTRCEKKHPLITETSEKPQDTTFSLCVSKIASHLVELMSRITWSSQCHDHQ